MAVTLRNLMKHDWFKHTITLVTDETGLDFILEIPEDTIDFANRNHLAVFSMPYHVKLIDVTKEIVEEILHSENKERMIFDFLSDLLSDNLKDEEVLKKEGYKCGI